jgi:hypothetical protein
MVAFNKAKGSAQKSGVDQYQMKNGDNAVRFVGDILARYVYWIEGENGKQIPFECLAYDREKEQFLNKEKDWVREYYPDLKCTWAYAIQCIDLSEDTPKVVVFNLKKKLLEQIKTAAEDLGDPTDPENGWGIYFKKTKTGPLAYNVEYSLQVAKCMKDQRPLTDAERAAVAAAKPIDEMLPRPTPDSQKELLERVSKGSTANVDTDTIGNEFDVS